MAALVPALGIRAFDGFPHTVPVVLSRSSGSLSAFSFLELTVTLVLVSIVAAIGAVTFSYVRNESQGFAAGPLLSSAQLEGRRLRTTDGTFPSSLLTGLNAGAGDEITYSSGDVSGASSVSVLREDELTAVYAVSAADDCLVLVDRPFGSSTWALLVDAGPTCNASTLATSVLALAETGSLAEPQVIEP